jgi:hypothetical protein
MQGDGSSALEAQLRDQPSSAVGGLADAHLSHLAEAIHAARRHQAAELSTASKQALDGVPRLLRGPIKKIVGG